MDLLGISNTKGKRKMLVKSNKFNWLEQLLPNIKILWVYYVFMLLCKTFAQLFNYQTHTHTQTHSSRQTDRLTHTLALKIEMFLLRLGWAIKSCSIIRACYFLSLFPPPLAQQCLPQCKSFSMHFSLASLWQIFKCEASFWSACLPNTKSCINDTP